MKDWDAFDWSVLGALVLIAALMGVALALPFYSCPARWSGSGLTAKYGFVTGCMVTRKDGSMVPEKAIRDVSL